MARTTDQKAYDPDTTYDTADTWDAAVAQSQIDWSNGKTPPINFGNADDTPTD
jgi:hypothetical protein